MISERQSTHALISARVQTPTLSHRSSGLDLNRWRVRAAGRVGTSPPPPPPPPPPSAVLDRDMEALDAEIAALEVSLGVMAAP